MLKLSKKGTVVEPQYIVQYEVGEGYSGRSTRLDSLNAKVNFDNNVITLPHLETLTQGSLLEPNLLVWGCDDNTMNSLEPV